MQESILYYFQTISTPFLDILAEGASILGEESIYIIVIAIIYWSISPKKGFILITVLILSLFINTTLKIIFHTARPFEVMAALEGKRLATATGYAFPSGHTQGATSFYLSLIYLYKQKIVRIPAVAAILLVGISRVYLGVHWPIDVLGGWIIGILIAWPIVSFIDRSQEDKNIRRLIVTCLVMATVVTLIMAVLEIMIFRGEVKTEDFFISAGIILGAFGGSLLLHRNFKMENSPPSLSNKVARIFVGLIIAFGIMEGLGALLGNHLALDLIRYALLGLWVTFLCPRLIFRQSS